MAFVYALIVPLWADQLLPQLLMKQFDTLSIQCGHIEHMHEGVIIFVELSQLFPYMAFVYAWIVPLFLVNTKYVSSHVVKISAFSLVLCREMFVIFKSLSFYRKEFAAAWMNLGIVKASLKKPAEAERCYFYCP